MEFIWTQPILQSSDANDKDESKEAIILHGIYAVRTKQPSCLVPLNPGWTLASCEILLVFVFEYFLTLLPDMLADARSICEQEYGKRIQQ